MHRLQEFVVRTVLPDLEALNECLKNGELAAVTCQRATVFEAFLWLHLGFEIGSFPTRFCMDIYNEYFVPFVDSLLVTQAGKLALDELMSLFPSFRKLIEAAVAKMTVFSVQLCDFSDPKALGGPFQTALMLYSRFSMHPPVRRFTTYLNFRISEEWEELWTVECKPDELIDIDLGYKDGSDTAACYVGYLSFWRYTARLKQLFKCYEVSGNGNWDFFSDMLKLRERLQDIHRWRINLSSHETARRFEAIRENLTRHVQQQASSGQGIHPGSAKIIEESIEDVFGFWTVRTPTPQPVPA